MEYFMKEIMPGDGAPRPPEVISLAPEDSAIAVAAVSYYVISSTRTLEANWDAEGFHRLYANVDSALGNLDTLSAFVGQGKDLATKLADHNNNPDKAVELTDQEIEMLGFSLFRFSNEGYVHATKALDTGEVVPVGEHTERNAREELDRRQMQSKKIFDQLAPLAMESQVRWVDWS
jgi:hypothetical protein